MNFYSLSAIFRHPSSILQRKIGAALKKIQKFTVLDNMQKRLFIEAYVTLGMMRAAILTVSFKRLVKSLTQQKYAQAPSLNDEQLTKAVVIGKAVRSAAANTPWESLCLAQALTAQRMLSKRGIAGIFHLGAMMGGTGEEKLKAHAWLQCDQQIITGEAGHEEHAVLLTFSWSGRV